jgi:hypothetical protein
MKNQNKENSIFNTEMPKAIIFIFAFLIFFCSSHAALAYLDSDRGITHFRVSNITQTGAVITYNTAGTQDTHVLCTTTSGTYSGSRYLANVSSTSHRATFDDLSPGSQYVCLIILKYEPIWDAHDQSDPWHRELHYFTTAIRLTSISPPPLINHLIDTAAPGIKNIHVLNITRTTALVTWETTEKANKYIEYGPRGSIIHQEQDDNLTFHWASLTGLPAGSAISYRIRARDAAGNVGYGSWKTFDTHSVENNSSAPPGGNTPQNPPAADNQAPQISNIDVYNISAASAKVSWKTNEESTSWIFVAKDADDNTPIDNYEHFGRNDGETIHNVSISNLDPSITYSFKVMSQDSAGNAGYSSRDTFITASSASGASYNDQILIPNDTGADPFAGVTSTQTPAGDSPTSPSDQSIIQDYSSAVSGGTFAGNPAMAVLVGINHLIDGIYEKLPISHISDRTAAFSLIAITLFELILFLLFIYICV